jgi:hypothetical protein
MSDPLELVIELELKSIQEEIGAVQARLQALEQEQAEAVDAEGEALKLASEAHAYADPLVWQTGREHVSAQEETHVVQVGMVVGDTLWRVNYPDAAQALGQAQAADRAVQLASARTIKLGEMRDDLRWRVLPYLHGRRDDKQKELEAHRAAQQQAMAHVADPTWLDAFRRKIRGET